MQNSLDRGSVFTTQPTTDNRSVLRRNVKHGFQYISTGVLLLILSAVMLTGVQTSSFHPDESHWIFTTRYVVLFQHRDFGSPEWDAYWVHVTPPLARYLMGMSLEAAGFDPLHVNGFWDYTKGDAENNTLGNMPAPALLTQARLAMAVAACMAVLFLFLVGRLLAGTLAGLVAAAWIALNPVPRELMDRATNDGLVLGLLLVSLWLSLRFACSSATGWRSASWGSRLAWMILLGCIFGLATSAKLTGVLGLAAFAVAIVLDTLVRWLAAGPYRAARQWRTLLSHWAQDACLISGVTLIAFLLFIFLNPALLYRRPHAVGE